MKGLDTRAKLGGYYDQDKESSQKYLTFINQINNTQININDKKRLASKKTIQEDKLEVVTQRDKSNVIDIDNPNDNDRDDQYQDHDIHEVG